MHTCDDVREEGYHIVVTHCHVGDNLFERNLLCGIVLVFLTAAIELEAQLGNFSL